jgi:hypothetical protein
MLGCRTAGNPTYAATQSRSPYVACGIRDEEPWIPQATGYLLADYVWEQTDIVSLISEQEPKKLALTKRKFWTKIP